MINFVKISFYLTLLFFSLNTVAQKGIVRGFIYNEKTGEPEIGATVFLKGTTIGAATDINGFYSITKIKAGSYTLMATSLGFDTAQVKISIKANQIISKKLFIKEQAQFIKTFNVSAEKQEAKTEVRVSVAKITPKEINSIPAIGGEPDLAQYLQVLPGVVFTGDQGGQLYVRGGSPVQNKVLLDGMIIYNPFHSIGLFSVFDTDIIRSADVYTGGFNAEYGGRASSVIDVTTRDGDKKRLRGKVSASSFTSKILLEGPLKKAKEVNDGSISFVVSAKHSYLEQSSSIYQPYFEALGSDNTRGIDTAGLPYGFTDIYGKISMSGANGSKVSFFGFNFRDNVNFTEVIGLNWNAAGGGANFVLIPSSSKTLIEGVIAVSNYSIELSEADGLPRRSDVNGFNAGMDFTSFSGNNQLKYGFEINGFRTNYEFFNSVNAQIQQEENTTELSGFLTYRWNIGKMIIEPSLRVQRYASLDATSIEPRFGYKYNVTDNFRLKLAAGVYSQNLISANSDRDVVNLFYGFLSGPDNLPETFTDEDGNVREINSKLQTANHIVTGFEFDITNAIGLNVEGYYKRFTQLTNINRNQIFNQGDVSAIGQPEIFTSEFIIETGDSYGIDFSLKYAATHFNVWVVYSLAKSTRWDGIVTYAPVFDRRHNLNFLASYVFGKDLNWEFNARWNLGSGFPFTQIGGFYEGIAFSTIDQQFTSTNGTLDIQLAELNGARLPYYHRLDLNIKRKFVLGKNSILETNISVTNAYNRQNLFFVDEVTADEVYQLPLIPSLGFSLTF